MGGQGALLLAFKYPALFSSAIGMAPGLCTGEELLVRQTFTPLSTPRSSQQPSRCPCPLLCTHKPESLSVRLLQ